MAYFMTHRPNRRTDLHVSCLHVFTLRRHTPRGAGRAAPAGTTGSPLGTGSGVASPSSTGSGLPLVSGANGSVNNPIRKIAHIVMALYRKGSDELGSPVA